MGLSPLRNHKKNHEFLDTPNENCLCNYGIEGTNHFLFYCPLYLTQRAILMASVAVILRNYNLENLSNQSQLYLYGEKSIGLPDNKIILLSTISFIKATGRFTS